jgi:S1-C subfamily serine protease
MNLVDIIVLLLCFAAAWRGYRRGMMGQLFEFGGGFLGLVAGLALGPRIADAFVDEPGVQSAITSLIAVFVFLSVGQTIGFLLGHKFGNFAKRVRLGKLDQVLGAGFGAVITLVSFWLIGSLLTQGPSREVARALRKSTLLRAMNQSLPDPPNVLAYLRQYLDTSGFPQVFVNLPPEAGRPVDLPPRGIERQMSGRAGPSTVRIEAPACGGTQLGSGWIASPDTVVTNAHVVAGATDVSVIELSQTLSATVVLFDPDKDLAVLHVEGLTQEPLDLVTEEQERGQPGVTMGYPGGGALTVHRAAVQAVYDARGRDIYGQDEVTREVYEVRSPVRKGDSGGPFVLRSGDVAGVVFAASTTDPQLGYALTGAEVVEDVEEGIGRTEPVSTEGCTR